MAWLYVPGLEDSNSASSSPPELAPFVTSSGKAMPRPFSWRGWKTRPWIQRLSGMTSPPSTADRGVASWISSLRASRANPSAQQDGAEAPPTSVGSGTTSLESLAKYDPATSSWRTCAESSPLLNTTPSEPFSGRWPLSGTMRSGTCSARLTSARRTSGNGSSCWATPTTRDWKDGTSPSSNAPTNALLGRQAPRWSTPTANDARGSTHAYSRGNHTTLSLKLNGQIRNHAGHRDLDADPRTGQRVSLNPLFVERLMGFPPNWSIVRTGYAVSATELSHWWQRMRCELSQLGYRRSE